MGIVGDISRNIGPNFARYCDDVITVLVKNLQNRELDRAVKPTILSVFGDIAWAIGGNFEKFLQFVMHMLKQAGDSVMKTQLNDDDYELIEYLNQLREAICVAYTGINQGMRAEKADKMQAHFNDIMQFVLYIANEKQCSESVKRCACGIVGDMVESFGLAKVKPAVQHDQIQRLLLECQQSNDYSKETKDTATWALHLSRGM